PCSWSAYFSLAVVARGTAAPASSPQGWSAGAQGRGTDQAGSGVQGQRPRFKQITRRQAHHSGSGAWAAPKGARSQPGGRSGTGGGGNGTQPRSPRHGGGRRGGCPSGGTIEATVPPPAETSVIPAWPSGARCSTLGGPSSLSQPAPFPGSQPM